MNYKDNQYSQERIALTKLKLLDKFQNYKFDYNLISNGFDISFEIIPTNYLKEHFDFVLYLKDTNIENCYCVLKCDYIKRDIKTILIDSNVFEEVYNKFEEEIFLLIENYLIQPNF